MAGVTVGEVCVCIHPAALLDRGAALPALTSTELAEVCLAYLPASLYLCWLPRIPDPVFLLPAQTRFKQLAAFHTASDGSITAEGRA